MESQTQRNDFREQLGASSPSAQPVSLRDACRGEGARLASWHPMPGLLLRRGVEGFQIRGFIGLERREDRQSTSINVPQTRNTCWPPKLGFGWFTESEGLTGAPVASGNVEGLQRRHKH